MAKGALDKLLENAAAEPEVPQEPVEVPQTAQQIVAESNRKLAVAQAETKKNYVELVSQDKVEISMAPMYRPYFGDVMTVSLNGLSIYFPLDGRAYKVPVAYAMIIQQRRRAVDDYITRTNKMADVQSNLEQTPGDLELIPR